MISDHLIFEICIYGKYSSSKEIKITKKKYIVRLMKKGKVATRVVNISTKYYISFCVEVINKFLTCLYFILRNCGS